MGPAGLKDFTNDGPGFYNHCDFYKALNDALDLAKLFSKL